MEIVSKMSLANDFYNEYKKLFECSQDLLYRKLSFDDVFKDNESRCLFINSLYELRYSQIASEKFNEQFDKSISFITKYMLGELDSQVDIDSRYFDDKEDNTIIPTNDELRTLFHYIECCKMVYEDFYKDKSFILELPKNTFYQNMTRIISIDEKNLAHLLGLTETIGKPNLLSKYFVWLDKNIYNNEYLYTIDENGNEVLKNGETISIRLLNWILSDEGQREILDLNNAINDFISIDMIKNSNNYENNNKIKSKSKKNVWSRFVEYKINSYDCTNLYKFLKDLKNNNQDEICFPILKYSRYMTHTINLLNFLNMSNTSQVILDYNSPQSEKCVKDIFFVNSSWKDLKEEYKKYAAFKKGYLKNYEKYLYGNSIERSKAIQKLLKNGASIDKQYTSHCFPNADKELLDYLKNNPVILSIKKEKEIEDKINLDKTRTFLKNQGIISKREDTSDFFIRRYLKLNPLRKIHLVGFGTYFNNNFETELEEFTINKTHCDTSISISTPELVDKYYKYGNYYFLDKIYNCETYETINAVKDKSFIDSSSQNNVRISSIQEELSYLNSYLLINNNKKLQKRKELLEKTYKLLLLYYKYYLVKSENNIYSHYGDIILAIQYAIINKKIEYDGYYYKVNNELYSEEEIRYLIPKEEEIFGTNYLSKYINKKEKKLIKNKRK